MGIFHKLVRTGIGALVGALLPFMGAQAQQSVLQGGNWTAGHFPIYAPGSGSTQPVIIDSGSAPAVIGNGTAGQLGWYQTSGTVISGALNANLVNGNLTLGQAGSVLGSLSLTGSSTGVVSLIPQGSAGTWNFNLPTTAGTAGGPLTSGGGGSTPMVWGTRSGNTTAFATVSGALTSGHCAVFDVSGNLVDNGSGCGGSGTVNAGSAGQFAQYPASTTAVSGSSLMSYTGSTISISGGLTVNPSNLNVLLTPSGTGFVTINPASAGTIDDMVIGGSTPLAITGTTISARNGLASGVAGSTIGSLSLSGNTSGTIIVQPQAIAGSYNFNLPNTAGSSRQPLLSGGGGAGGMTWGTVSGSTSSFATTSGALTSGHVAAFDASGNIVDGGSPPTGTINSGTTGQMAWFAGNGTTLSGNANLTISAGAVTAGVAGAAAGTFSVTGSSSGTIVIGGSSATIGSYNFNLPTTAGSANQPLLSGGGGASAMTWGARSGNTTTFGTVTGALTNGHCLAADASGNIIDNGSTCGTGGSGTVTSSSAGQVAYYASSTNAVAGNSSLTMSGSALTVGVAGAATGSVAVTGVTSGTVTIKPQAVAGTYEFDLPTTAGSAGQVLTSQGGAGTAMTWSTAGHAAITGQATSFNAAAGGAYCVDTTGGAITATLAASPANNDEILFIDCKNNWGTTALTVAPNGNKIMNISASMTVNTTNANFHLIYYSANSSWLLY